MKAMTFVALSVSVCALLGLPATGQAGPVGTAFTYQGQLKLAGVPVNGSADLEFGLWDDPNSTDPNSQVGSTQAVSDVAVSNGLFTVEVDFGGGAFTGDARWLAIAVRVPHDPNDAAPFTTLDPRQELTPAPYAIHASTAGAVPGAITGSGTANYVAKFTGSNTIGNSVIYQSAANNVGIGTTSLDAKLEVNAASGVGVRGEGVSEGVAGYASATSGWGVRGYAGSMGATDANIGGWFCAWGGKGMGIKAFAAKGGTGTENYGGYFYANGAGGSTGVYGEATETGAFANYGGQFVAKGRDGRGVYGEATGYYGHGVHGKATGSSGYAGYFEGPVRVTGYLYKDGGGFQIDHPLEPATKYLCHSFVESPDMMNVYNGNVVLDKKGQAKVELPGYFEALNSDFRYQLTCVGEFAPVYIAEEITKNSFKIAGGRPGMKVSWQVTGIRKDAWADANRIPVEVDKLPHERARYAGPSGHGVVKPSRGALCDEADQTGQAREQSEQVARQDLPAKGIKP